MSDAVTLFDRLGGRPAINILLRNFYATVRIDREIGPIFESRVHDWPAHLENIADFWSTQTGGPSVYRGGMGKHFSLDLKPRHFELWLKYWENSCLRHFPETEARELMAIAEGFRTRMLATFDNPGRFRFSP